MNSAQMFLTWDLALVFGLFGLTILLYVWRGRIDLARLTSGKDGSASMARFQLLVFTFVVGISLFLIVVSSPAAFPDIPPGILALLGISSGMYAVGKGIQTAGETATLAQQAAAAMGP